MSSSSPPSSAGSWDLLTSRVFASPAVDTPLGKSGVPGGVGRSNSCPGSGSEGFRGTNGWV
jgi:hypothetical protein